MGENHLEVTSGILKKNIFIQVDSITSSAVKAPSGERFGKQPYLLTLTLSLPSNYNVLLSVATNTSQITYNQPQ